MATNTPTIYEAITAIATAVLAVATLILAIVVWVIAIAEGRRSRFSLGVDVAMKLDEQWNEDYLDRRRSAAAALLLPPDKRGSGDEDHIEDVLDFFETLGHLTRRGALDAEMVWSYFFYWFYGYWLSARRFLEQQAGQYRSRYDDLVWLLPRLIEIETRKGGSPEDQEWKDFLNEESQLH